jgi:Kef-type K+ transport system membrane component KefB
VHYANLLIVVTIGLLAPLALGFFPRFRLPAIVLELVLGIVIGPSGLGWAKPDLPVSILALIGPAFLLFLSGLEIDVERLQGPVLKLTTIGFALSFAIAITLGLGLKAGGFVKSPLFVAIVLAASSVSVIFPVLKDADVTSSRFGQLVLASASVAEFGAIILLSLFFSGKGSSSTTGTLILVGVFGLVVALVGVAIAGVERSIGLSHVLRRLQDTTAQIRVRAAFVLMIGFAALADQFGLETILGAFAAGVLLSLIDRDQTTHPQFRLKLEAAAFGVFIPVFFVTSGLRFNLNALFASPSTVARVPLFLLTIYLARRLRDRVRATARPLALGDRRRASSHLPDGHRRRHPNWAPAGRGQPGERRGTRCRRSSLGGDLPGSRTRAVPPRTARKSFKGLDPARAVGVSAEFHAQRRYGAAGPDWVAERRNAMSYGPCVKNPMTNSTSPFSPPSRRAAARRQ